MMGNKREKTTAVGLLNMEIRLALAIAMAAFRLLYRSGIYSDKPTQLNYKNMNTEKLIVNANTGLILSDEAQNCFQAKIENYRGC